MMATRAKKRDRSNMSTHEDKEDEYERAVAFLHEFHSRRVAATLHSTSLDAILEAEHFDEMLAGDFSLALSVGRRGSLSTNDLLSRKEDQKATSVKDSGVYAKSDAVWLQKSPGTLSRMKKTATSTCLLGLDATSSSENGGKSPSLRRGLYPLQESSSELNAADYYLGHDVAKRRRSLSGRAPRKRHES